MSRQYDEHCFIHNPQNGYIWRIAKMANGWARLEHADTREVGYPHLNFHVRPVREIDRFFASGRCAERGHRMPEVETP